MLPAGYIKSNNSRDFENEHAYFWSATESENEEDAYFMVLVYNSYGAAVTNTNTDNNFSKTSRMSIRCLKD